MKHANNKTNEAVVEWELASLPLGARVRCHYPNLNGNYPHVTPARQIPNTRPYDDGWLLDHCVGRCVVFNARTEKRESWADQTAVEFFGVDEEMAATIAEEQGKAERRRHSQRPQGQILVETLQHHVTGAIERGEAVAVVAITEVQPAMALTSTSTSKSDDPKHRSIGVRWEFQLKQLTGALESGNDAKAEQARNAILKIVDDAGANGMSHLSPSAAEYNPILADDTVFGLDEVARLLVATPAVAMGKQLGSVVTAGEGRTGTMATKKVVGATAGAAASDAPAPGSFADNKAKTKAKAAATKQVGGETAPAVAKVPKAPKPLNDCLDGCGAKVKGRFAMGHDAKLKSLILKVERGDAAREDIPEIAQPYVSFTKGDVEITKADGKEVKVQLYNCAKAPVRFPGRPDIEYAE